MPRTVAVLVDIGNLFYCIGKKFDNRKLDYDLYMKAILGQDVLYRAFAYGSKIGGEATSFIDCLKKAGFEPKYKKMQPEESSPGVHVAMRIDWNVAIAMDAVRLISRVDTIILGSADRAVVPLVEWVQGQGVRCTVFACGIHKELKRVADEYTEIEETLLEVRAAC